jgi:hypothetical protein
MQHNYINEQGYFRICYCATCEGNYKAYFEQNKVYYQSGEGKDQRVMKLIKEHNLENLIVRCPEM